MTVKKPDLPLFPPKIPYEDTETWHSNLTPSTHIRFKRVSLFILFFLHGLRQQRKTRPSKRGHICILGLSLSHTLLRLTLMYTFVVGFSTTLLNVIWSNLAVCFLFFKTLPVDRKWQDVSQTIEDTRVTVFEEKSGKVYRKDIDVVILWLINCLLAKLKLAYEQHATRLLSNQELWLLANDWLANNLQRDNKAFKSVIQIMWRKGDSKNESKVHFPQKCWKITEKKSPSS